MPTAISSLPPEILLDILSKLNPFDLENVAKTLNRHLYNTARPILTQAAPWIANARRMTSIFPLKADPRAQASYPGCLRPFQTGHYALDEISSSNYEPLGLDPRKGPYIYSAPPDLHWMNLDGSFWWLEPLVQEIADEMEVHTGIEGDRLLATPEQFKLLARQASEVGVTLPQGFEAFAKSDRLHHRIPSASAWFFQLSTIIKCPPSVDNGAGGYMIRFHSDQQHSAFAYLYMNTHGEHCVVFSVVDLFVGFNSEIPVEGAPRHPSELEARCREFSRPANDSFPLAGLTFEEYLVSACFQELLAFQEIDDFEAPPTKGLKDYVSHVYRKPAEL